MSALLFHGPGAEQAATTEAHKKGRLLAPPFGKGGLKVDEAREVVSLLSSIPVGSGLGVVVVGPVDQCSPKSNDTLLKCVEEFSTSVFPILWADDLGGVAPTLRSRCLPKWSPLQKIFLAENDELEEAGRNIASFLDKRKQDIPGIVQKFSGSLLPLLGVVADALLAENKILVWERIRPVTCYVNPTPIEVLSVLLQGDKHV